MQRLGSQLFSLKSLSQYHFRTLKRYASAIQFLVHHIKQLKIFHCIFHRGLDGRSIHQTFIHLLELRGIGVFE